MNLKDYIPLVSALVIVLGWAVTYFFNLKLKAKETFLSRTENDIRNLLLHMIADLRGIREEKHHPTHLRKIKSFFEKYRSPSSHLYLSTSSLIIKQFNHFEEHYVLYQNNNSCEQLDNLYTSLSILEDSLNLKLSEYRQVLFKQYNWFYRVEKSPFIVRIYAELLKIVLQAFSALALTALIIVFATLIEGALYYSLFTMIQLNVELYFWPYLNQILGYALATGFLWTLLHLLDWLMYSFKESPGSKNYTNKQIDYHKKNKSFLSLQITPLPANKEKEEAVENSANTNPIIN
nr:hypothetical protein [Paenibacillus xylanexedens]